MDKTDLAKRADELMAFILQGLEQGKEFAAEQAPLLIREVVTWGIVSNAIVVTFCLGIAVSFALTFRWCREQNKDKRYGEPGYEIGMVFSCLGIALSTMFTIISVVEMFQAIYAPRLYLLGALKGLIK